MNADEAMNHHVYSWSDTDDIRAILALQAEVQRLRTVGFDYAERVKTLETRLARVETLLRMEMFMGTDQGRALAHALRGEP